MTSNDGTASRQLTEQQNYYRAIASHYDEDAYGDSGGPLADANAALDFLDVTGHALELACGTGQWTRLLRPRVTGLTCIDQSAEMLAHARTRTEVDGDIEFTQADIFTWQRTRRYDSVFFGFWLSHLPRPLWPTFWSFLDDVLEPGGVVGVIDESAEGVRTKEAWVAPEVAQRRAPDGSSFQVVKLLLEPHDVAEDLARLGWQTHTLEFRPGMFALRATR